VRGEAAQEARRGERLSGGAVGTPSRGPESAFNALKRCGAWQPRDNCALPGGPGAARGSDRWDPLVSVF
jgi:hypothetical protein